MDTNNRFYQIDYFPWIPQGQQLFRPLPPFKDGWILVTLVIKDGQAANAFLMVIARKFTLDLIKKIKAKK